MPSIAIGANEQFILFQQLYQRALVPGDDLPCAALVCTHQVVGVIR